MAPSGANGTPEQPDTTSIRAEWYAGMNIMDAKDCIRALCDALDDARGARDYWRNRNIDLKRQEATNAALLAGAYEVSRKALDRAEAAEAQIVELDHLAATQAARIAAALTMVDGCGSTTAFRAALNGEYT